jgi:cytochrome b
MNAAKSIHVWDLPTRLFHWLLVALFAFSWASAELGGNAMEWHMLSGYGLLGLVVFRLLWGIAGSATARFGQFVKGRGAILAYVRGFARKDAPPSVGHNPLGGWMVVFMLSLLLLQGATGLFANDDIVTEGPLYHLISKELSDQLTELHEGVFNALLTLVAVHLSAIFFYLLVKRDNLIRPMITGRKQVPAETAQPFMVSVWRALPLAAIAAAAVYLLVTRL